MALVLKVPPIPGSEALLALLTDDSAAKGYLQSMEDMRTEINGMVEAVGTIKEIDSLVVKTRSDREKAATALAKAEARAEINAAWVEDEKATLSARVREIVREAAKTKADQDEIQASINEQMQRATDRESAVQDRENAIGEAEALAESARLNAEAAKSRFDSAISDIAGVVKMVG